MEVPTQFSTITPYGLYAESKTNDALPVTLAEFPKSKLITDTDSKTFKSTLISSKA